MKMHRRDFPMAPYHEYDEGHLHSWTLVIWTDKRVGYYQGDYTKNEPWEIRTELRNGMYDYLPSLMRFIKDADANKASLIEFVASTIECKITAVLFKKRWM